MFNGVQSVTKDGINVELAYRKTNQVFHDGNLNILDEVFCDIYKASGIDNTNLNGDFNAEIKSLSNNNSIENNDVN